MAISGLQERKTEIAQLPPSGWTQVSGTDEVEKKESEGVTIEIGKCRVSVENTANMELLTKVCKMLANLC